MGWEIECVEGCGKVAVAKDIVDLIQNYIGPGGWLRCSCGKRGQVKKSFEKQEGGKWEPMVKGIIPLGVKGKIHQPFVFLVRYEEDGSEVDAVWFSYYKDLRKYPVKGGGFGHLKLGYGPGGPPVFDRVTFLKLLASLVESGSYSRQEIVDAVSKS